MKGKKMKKRVLFALSALHALASLAMAGSDACIGLVFEEKSIFIEFPRGERFRPKSVSAAVLTGDGDVDILPRHPSVSPSSFLKMLPEQGDGVFGEPALLPIDDLPLMARLADLDGESDTDIIVNGCRGVTVLNMLDLADIVSFVNAFANDCDQKAGD